MRNIEKLSKPIYIVKGLSDDYYHVATVNTADGTDVLFSSDNGIELLSFVSGYNINAQIKINEDELENLIAELSK
ncbi:hypothetical protein A8C40_00890 [Ligilactobacillus salivarius]|nr:hypothetical protein A8C40_00890 [Ligilactobacillus salivarius]